MEVLHPRCAGLDVHKDSVVACVRVVSEAGVEHWVATFGTTTSSLLELSDWLEQRGVTVVAMEATGVYWKPVWHILEGAFDLVLANASHVRNVPGRKTDVNDATWIADLLAHGLIRASFVPPTAIQELRALTRTRKQLVRERATHVNRIEKVLQDANLKIGSVLSNIVGQSGRRLLAAILNGESDPDRLLAGVELRRLKASRAQLLEALRGRITAHHRFLLQLHLDQVDSLDRAIAAIETEVGTSLDSFRVAIEWLTTIPGVSDTAASVLVAEIGVDMTRFPTAGHLISWAGLCPKNDESAGKRRSNRLRRGAPWLKTTLVQCAWAAARSHDTYLRAQFLRIRTRRGPRKAIIAVAASILTAAYHMLLNGTPYRELGAHHFDRDDRERAAQRLVKRIQSLGYDVDIREAA
jgi:transposase